MFAAVVICLAALTALGRGQISPTESYTHSATLRSGTINLYWKFNETYITFEVHGQTTGWVGIGFSPNGAMTGADIYIGWVKNGQVNVTDRYATSNFLPSLDPVQNIDILDGAERDGWTMFKFSRQLAACEAEYDREITQDTQRLIYAWGDADPSGDDVVGANYHGGNRGVESMYFLESSDSPSGLPEGPVYNTMDFLMDNFEIPAVATYYNCKLFKLPEFSQKQHIVKMEPIVQAGNELNVHHILVYRCGDVLQNETELELDAKCYLPDMAHFESCSTVIGAWAIGGEDFLYPANAGFSIGLEGDPIYIQLEMHYDNPNTQSGIIDSSGIRFTYTNTTREYDVGILDVGVITSGTDLIIPPGATNFTVSGHCSPFCLANKMADVGVDNVTVFGVMLHSHLAGRSLKLRHIGQDGVELPYLASDATYDFNYQESRYVNPPNGATLKSTDRLIMECVYNTEGKTGVTEGGFATTQEMCLSFVYYYPKIDLGLCQSSVPYQLSWPYFGINVTGVVEVNETVDDGITLNNFALTTPAEVAGVTVKDYLDGFNWTSDTIAYYQGIFSTALQYELCIHQNTSETTFKTFNITEVAVPLVEQARECIVPPSGMTTTPTTPSTTSDSVMPRVAISLLHLCFLCVLSVIFG